MRQKVSQSVGGPFQSVSQSSAKGIIVKVQLTKREPNYNTHTKNVLHLYIQFMCESMYQYEGAKINYLLAAILMKQNFLPHSKKACMRVVCFGSNQKKAYDYRNLTSNSHD